MIKSDVKEAVILAGGRGERLRPFTDTLPKPMYPIDGIPFIVRLVEQVKGFGIDKIVILLGYKADKVVEVLGDGSNYGVEIVYDITPVEYDTGDRLLHAKDKLDDKFLLMYCDNYCPIDFPRLVREFNENNAMIQMSVYSNKDGYTKNNIRMNTNGRLVDIYDKNRTAYGLQGVEIGYSIVKKEAIDLVNDEVRNFTKAVFPKLVSMQKLYATVTDHRYYSIGSYERMPLTEEFFREKKVVFLDRDGTINVRAPKACYIEKPEEFVWLDGAIDAIKLLNDDGIITILITNQPGLARGNLTIDDLNSIHEKMQNDLKEHGAHIDHIYYCPHNWHDGCDCRKPKPGMLYQAARDLSLNLPECMLFGDDERDIEAANAARCMSTLVSEDYPLLEAVKDYLKKDKVKTKIKKER